MQTRRAKKSRDFCNPPVCSTTTRSHHSRSHPRSRPRTLPVRRPMCTPFSRLRPDLQRPCIPVAVSACRPCCGLHGSCVPNRDPRHGLTRRYVGIVSGGPMRRQRRADDVKSAILKRLESIRGLSASARKRSGVWPGAVQG